MSVHICCVCNFNRVLEWMACRRKTEGACLACASALRFQAPQGSRRLWQHGLDSFACRAAEAQIRDWRLWLTPSPNREKTCLARVRIMILSQSLSGSQALTIARNTRAIVVGASSAATIVGTRSGRQTSECALLIYYVHDTPPFRFVYQFQKYFAQFNSVTIP
jgi:hypothetical protein